MTKKSSQASILLPLSALVVVFAAGNLLVRLPHPAKQYITRPAPVIASASYEGVYQNPTYKLDVVAGGQAKFTTSNPNRVPTTQVGTWSLDKMGNVVVTLPKSILNFTFTNNQLSYVGSMFGTEKLVLTKTK